MHQETGILFATQKHNLIWERIFDGLLFGFNRDEPLFWILDGLDEAESPSAIIDLISNTESATPIKILVVSRHTKDLSVALKMVQWPAAVYHEEIQTSDTAEDIRSYNVAANIY
jgi:hypothetical protein